MCKQLRNNLHHSTYVKILYMKLLIFGLVFISSIVNGQDQIGSTIFGEGAADISGTSVSLSSEGTRIAIGAPFNDGNGTDYGHVRIYQEVNSSWVQIGDDIDGDETFDFIGRAVSISSDGTRFVVSGSSILSDGNRVGKFRVYEEVDNIWIQIGSDVSGNVISDGFGQDLSISADGTRIVVGIPFSNDNGENSGQVKVYEELNNNWSQIGLEINGEQSFEGIGGTVSISDYGHRIAFGLRSRPDNFARLRVYEESNGVWNKLGNDISIEEPSYSASVAISGDGRRVIMGYDDNNLNKGSVRIFEEDNQNWLQIGGELEGENSEDLFGGALSISGDGKVIVVGAGWNSEIGINSGHARIFKENENIWTQVGVDIDGDEADDFFGASVSVSSDGNRIAIGADQFNNFEVFNPGYVKIYSIDGSLPISFLSFNGQQEGKIILLNWSIDHNESITAFDVEHSEDGVNWNRIGNTVNPTEFIELNEYSFIHNAPSLGNNYYRIIQTELDGSTYISSTVNIYYDKDEKTVFVYPNPASNNLYISDLNALDIQSILIYHMDGKLIKSLDRNLLLVNLKGIKSGDYLLQIVTSDDIYIKRIIIK